MQLQESRPRVLQVVSICSQDPMGGAERTLLQIMERGRHRFDFFVATSGPGEFSSAVRKLCIPLVILPLRPPFASSESPTPWEKGVFLANGMRDTISLWRAVDHLKIDLVCTLTRGAHIYGSLPARVARLPLIFQLHDIPQKPLARMVYRALFRTCATAGLSVSQIGADEFAGVSGSSRSSKTWRISPNGVDVTDFCTRVAGATLSMVDLGLETHYYPVVVTVGRLSPHKGIHVFLEAAGLVKQHFPDAAFVIVGVEWGGSQTYSTYLRRMVDELGLQSHVRFLGQREDIPEILSQSDVLVSASQFEIFGLALVEGMLAGLPVIATRSGGPEEIITHGKDGFLVPVNDAQAIADTIVKLAREPTLAREIGDRAIQKAQTEFSIERHVADVLNFYEEILEKYGSTH